MGTNGVWVARGRGGSNTILSSFVGTLPHSRQGSLPQCQTWTAINNGEAPLRGEGGGTAHCSVGEPHPSLEFSLWQEQRDYMELTQYPQRQLPRLGRTHDLTAPGIIVLIHKRRVQG